VNRPPGQSLISRCRPWAPLVVVAAVLAGAAAGAAAAGAAPLVRVDVPRFVSRHLPLEVHLAPGARLAHVAVDRRKVTDRLRGRGRVLRARLPRRLLRQGPNHVTVVVRDRGGRPVTVTRRSFLLPARLRASRAPLADAGPDVGGVARRPIRLDGSGSLARGGRRLSYTWRIVRAPRGSHPRLRNRHRRRARLIARRAGRYRLALTVTKRRGGRRPRSGLAASIDDSSSDFANAEVSPAMTPQGLRVDVTPSTGISFTAPDGSPTGKDWGWPGDSGHAHMLVLDRTTLQSYPYTLPTDATIDSTLDANLQPFLPGSTSSSFLAILTGAPGCCDASKTLPHGMGFSYVFVPRTGKDDIRTGVSNEGLKAVLGRAAEPGEITGALQPSPDQASGSQNSTVFSFTQPDVLPYDTNASADPAAGRTLLIQSIGTSMVVDNPGGTGTVGQAMQMYTRLDNQNQGWTLTDTGAGDGYVELVNQASNLCLDASGNGGAAPGPGAVVRQAACTGSPGQLWHSDRAAGTESVYYLSPQAAKNLVLTVAGPNPRQRGTGLTLVQSTQASVQQWRFALPGATFRVGDRTYNVAPPAAPEWWTRASFAVLALDPGGDPWPGYPKRFDVITGNPDSDANGQQAMYNELVHDAATPGTTVLIQSIRNPSPGHQQAHGGWWWAIGRDPISGYGFGPGLGGSQWAFDRLTDDGGYAFVGCAGCRDAAQSAHAVTRNADDGRLSGLLVRDGQSRLAPLLSTPGDEYDADVTSLASQAPKPWPASGTPAEKAMLGYVANQLDLKNLPYPGCAALAPVRDAYCNANFAGAVEQNKLTEKVSCAATLQYNGQTIDTDTCNRVRSQLFDEFGDVELVQKYVANLKAPLASAAGDTFLDLGALTNAVNNQVKAPPDAHVGWSFYEIVESLGEVGVTMFAEQFPGLELSWSILTQAINASRTAAELIGRDEAGDGTSADELTTAVSALGSELQARYKDAAFNLSRLGALLVSDPDKLATAAEKTRGPWEVPLPSQDQATNTVSAAGRQWLYTSLMHQAYQLHSWDVCAPWRVSGSYCYWGGGSSPVYTMNCSGGSRNFPSTYYPFKDKGEPASGTFVQNLWWPWEQIKWMSVKAIARGPIHEPGGGSVPSSFAVPSAAVTDPLFQPVDLRNRNSGGVGLYPEYFFEPSQWTVINDNPLLSSGVCGS
jgi:hypothetical protein